MTESLREQSPVVMPDDPLAGLATSTAGTPAGEPVGTPAGPPVGPPVGLPPAGLPDGSAGGSPSLQGDPGGRRLDRAFRLLAGGSGVFVILLVSAVGAFLLLQAVPSLLANNASFLTERIWDVEDPNQLAFGIPGMLWTTVLAAGFALLLAVPLAVALALFLTQYAPARLSKPAASAVDLLAAVPSIVYGLWGIKVLQPAVAPVQSFLQSTLGWFPLFEATSVSAGTVFLAGLVLAVMILPVVTAISREVFAQTPLSHKEAALALGATRWEMIRVAVLPFGRPGTVSAAMLGLGRALGETVAVLIILSTTTGAFSWSLFFGGETFASKIAGSAQEFDTPAKAGAYIAAGLVLFSLTFAVNAVARTVANGGGPRRGGER